MKIIRAAKDGQTRYYDLEGGQVWPLEGELQALKRVPDGAPLLLDKVKLCAPCTPSKIVAVGPNYKAHLPGNPPPPRPYFWIKPPSTLNDPEGNTVLECVKAGDFQSANTLKELAKKCGIGAEALECEVQQYNEDLAKEIDRKFLRNLDGLFPISKPPYYAFEYRTSDVNLTGAGLRINSECHVLDKAGYIIPGLFAAGEAGAGVLGERYVGGGNAVANALTMGRVAGITIGNEVKEVHRAFATSKE